jgi:hypothetical protein
VLWWVRVCFRSHGYLSESAVPKSILDHVSGHLQYAVCRSYTSFRPVSWASGGLSFNCAAESVAPIHSLIHLLPKKHDPNVNLQHDITLNAYNGTITDKCCSTQWHGLLEFDVPTTKGLFTKGLQIDEALICSGPQTTKNPWFRLLIIQMSVESQILCFWVSQGVTLVTPNPYLWIP